ncbi:hypothetical protein DSOL_1310 [Desulfosporosinus metallidurans]|uniref:Uncharacterized protein n=1 Tax=Desulfosporosinus metallidurans TaxID=1888891 RepID=A0A1Q8QZT7_9FIRM|nr:hypothetical protein DSOL_1310 [Desulfosporosinus metallidurans]
MAYLYPLSVHHMHGENKKCKHKSGPLKGNFLEKEVISNDVDQKRPA